MARDKVDILCPQGSSLNTFPRTTLLGEVLREEGLEAKYI